MASKTEICNMSISHIGTGKEILNIDTETSEEAKVCRRFYDISRKDALRGYDWPFARVRLALALVEEDPNTEWKYAYRYPSGCVAVRRIESGLRNDTRQSRVSYELSNDDSGALIFTDCENAVMVYTEDLDSPDRYPADFVLAYSYKLASLIAPRLSKGDPFKIVGSMMELYGLAIERATGRASNEEQPDQLPESEFTRSRE